MNGTLRSRLSAELPRCATCGQGATWFTLAVAAAGVDFSFGQSPAEYADLSEHCWADNSGHEMAPIESAGQITSIAGLADAMGAFQGSRRLLFRGQSIDRPLLPRIARIAQEKGIERAQLEAIERRMLERLRKESVPHFPGRPPATVWEWLSVAQHQGLPTRLLDWTANALAGLWFAVSTDPLPGDNGVLWVLDVPSGFERTPTESDDPFDFKQTFVFQPFHLDQRIVSQAGWFTAHKFSDNFEKFLPLTSIGQFKRNVRKFTVPAGAFSEIRSSLRMMGVTQATMFPDLSGLCADIQADCVGSWQPLRTI